MHYSVKNTGTMAIKYRFFSTSTLSFLSHPPLAHTFHSSFIGTGAIWLDGVNMRFMKHITVCSSLHRWISWGVASLPEGKSQGLCLVQLCAKIQASKCYIDSLPLVLKIKEAASLKVKGLLPLDCVLALWK